MAQALTAGFDYQLLDIGDAARVERFANTIVKRPCPLAKTRAAQAPGFVADYCYSKTQWQPDADATWPIDCGAFRLQLRLASGGQIGIFPEQADNWTWIHQMLQHSQRPLRVLNLFAYTGASSLAAATASPMVQVTHVDGAKANVTWARQNAELNGIDSIRWIVDDVMRFLAKEQRRGQQYDAIIADPPAFGRGPKGRWQLQRDLPQLLEAIAAVCVARPRFILLSGHTPDMSLAQMQALCGAYFSAADYLGVPLDLHSQSAKRLRSSDTVRCVF